MQESKPPEEVMTKLHVIRTWRDKHTRELCVEHREIPVRVVDDGRLYRPVWTEALDEWEWAFDTTSAPAVKWRMGYSRYYHTDLPTLVERFLESRKEAVEAANAALTGAVEQLHAAEKFQQEVING